MKVTIGLPVYNSSLYLEDAIKSILLQTYEDFELIIIDDHSSDNSLEIIHSFSDSRIRIYAGDENKKLPFRLNQIISLAKHDYVVRMDSDDLSVRDRLEKQMEVFSNDANVDLVFTGVCSIDCHNSMKGVRLYENKEIFFNDVISGRTGFVHASVVGKKTWFERNMYNETNLLAEDYELWINAYIKGDLNFSIIPEPLYFYREDLNVTEVKLLRAYTSQIKVLENIVVDNYRYAYGLRCEIAKLKMKRVLAKIAFLTNQQDRLLSFRHNADIDNKLLDSLNNELSQYF